jgi:hypothetical protein
MNVRGPLIDKQYFSDEKIVAGAVVGGVTLNHLAWANALGAPVGLLALQGAHDFVKMTSLHQLCLQAQMQTALLSVPK